MIKTANSYKATLQLILDILRFDDNRSQLQSVLASTLDEDWDQLVSLASNHLVLTSVYCRLEQKQLLDQLPEDLVSYLQELSSINRNRNKTLIKEAQHVAKLFDSKNITYVFIKGMATLLSNCYTDLGERMIGDHDILIPEQDIDLAYQLLIDHGYSHLIGFNYDNKGFRHLDRQVNQDRLAAIELHREVLISGHRDLLDLSSIFKNKKLENGVYVASLKDLSQINILTTQLNNHNFYYNRLNFKNVYDSLAIWKKNEPIEAEELKNNRYISRYLSLLAVWGISVGIDTNGFSNNYHAKLYEFKLNRKRLDSNVYKVKSIVLGLFERLKLILNNKSYRHHIIKNKIFNKS